MDSGKMLRILETFPSCAVFKAHGDKAMVQPSGSAWWAVFLVGAQARVNALMFEAPGSFIQNTLLFPTRWQVLLVK